MLAKYQLQQSLAIVKTLRIQAEGCWNHVSQCQVPHQDIELKEKISEFLSHCHGKLLVSVLYRDLANDEMQGKEQVGRHYQEITRIKATTSLECEILFRILVKIGSKTISTKKHSRKYNEQVRKMEAFIRQG